MTRRDTTLWQNFCKKLGCSQQESTAKAKLCSKLWPEETARSKWTADLLLENTFWFKLPWDMEQTAEPVSFPNGIDWSYYPDNDPEFTYQLNRHRFWICLGQTYLATGDEKYVHCFVRQLLDWLEKEPWREEAAGTTWRTLDTGLRADYWVRTMALCAGSPAITEEVIEKFLRGLETHAKRLATNPRPVFSRKSNWGVMEYTGLYLLSFVLDLPEYRQTSKSYLRSALKVQIYDDGVHWESSPMYHNEVFMSLLEALRISDLYEDALFDEAERRVIEKMGMATLLLQTPNHHQPMTGDSDDTDVRDLLTQAALLLNSGSLKFGGFQELDYESIWLFGTEAAERYRQIPVQQIPADAVHLEDSGQILLRSSWEPNSLWLYFKNGPLGGGHGHADKLHLGLWMDGEEILSDWGRYTYTDSPERYFLKSAGGHNVPLAGEEYMEVTDTWTYKTLPVSLPNRIKQNGPYALIEGAHTGYASRGLTVVRRVVKLGQDAIVISDSFLGPVPETVSQKYHFAEQIQLKKQNGILCGSGNRCQFQMYSFAAGRPLEAAIENGSISRHYNHAAAAPAAEFTAHHTGCITTVLVRTGESEASVYPAPVLNAVRATPLETEQAEGYLIGVNDKRYGLVLLHQDVGNASDINGLEEVFGLGRTMVCDLNNSPQYMTVLQW